MAISTTVEVQETALWPQGDMRDPLGVWGARLGVSGDVSGGEIKVVLQVAADKKAAYVYTCYSAQIAVLTGTVVASGNACRLLTNWPNVDPQAGVQAYGSLIVRNTEGAGSTAPIGGVNDPLLYANDRFLLLFDPRPIGGAMEIVELKHEVNTNGNTYSFEAYGYFWDRSVLQAPGGPRHPGSN